LMKSSKVLPLTLHIKLGFKDKFVNVSDEKTPAFTYLCGKFRAGSLRENKSNCVYWSSNQTTF
jgi:hypothetical protein